MQNCRAFLLKSSNCVSNPLMQLVLVHIKSSVVMKYNSINIFQLFRVRPTYSPKHG